MQKNHVKEMLMLGKDGRFANSLICKDVPIICAEMLLGISEKNNSVNNMKRMPVVMGHFPSGSSSKNFEHFQQFTNSGEFKMFDYGEKKNLKVYGSKRPPFYDLSRITFPVNLYVGKYDKLADVKDASRLYAKSHFKIIL